LSETTSQILFDSDQPERLDKYLVYRFPDFSRSRLQRLIGDGFVLVNGVQPTKTGLLLEKDDVIEIRFPEPEPIDLIPENIHLEILYEDQNLLAINKPAGMVVHPSAGHSKGTLVHAVMGHVPLLEGIGGKLQPGIVHRLDKDTSGLLVVAKTLEAQTALIRQLQKHSMKRIYIALVLGDVKDDGWVDAPVGRHPVHRTKMAVTATGKEARTHYWVLEKLDGCTLLRCSLETGRTHQIRVHMHSLGHPLVGDPVYGGRPRGVRSHAGGLIADFRRQALHAQQLELTHPQTGRKVTWEAPIPDDISTLLLMLRQP